VGRIEADTPRTPPACAHRRSLLRSLELCVEGFYLSAELREAGLCEARRLARIGAQFCDLGCVDEGKWSRRSSNSSGAHEKLLTCASARARSSFTAASAFTARALAASRSSETPRLRVRSSASVACVVASCRGQSQGEGSRGPS
jgi:hypothetical protein